MLLPLLLTACAPDARTAPAPPNLVVVILDDVGVDRIGHYGLPAPTPPTPHLDALAARSVRFTTAWALPQCSPTRASLLTGRMPSVTGIGNVLDDRRPRERLSGLPTAAQVLADAGYTPLLAGKWHLAPPDALDHPAESGFAWHAGTMESVGDDGGNYLTWQENRNGVLVDLEGYLTAHTVDDALEQLAVTPEPWFLLLSLNAAHAPFTLPPEGYDRPVGPAPADRYDAVLTAADRELGRFFAGLRAVEDRTHVIVVGDNGTPDDAVRPPATRGRAKGSLHDLGVHVPLWVAGPSVRQPGAASDALVHVVDVLPTLAAWAGADAPPGEGLSLLPWLADPGRPSGREALYAERFQPNGSGADGWGRMVRDATHLLAVTDRDPDGALYRFEPGAIDEGERLTTLGADDRAARDRLQAALDAMVARIDALPRE